MRSVAWVSEKGGVGKTTCAVNTAVALAKSGKRVLAVDADPQGNLSLVLTGGQGARGRPTLFGVLTDDQDPRKAILGTATPGLELLPADTQLADANVILAGEVGRERRLRLALEPIAGGYDFIVLDASPQRSLLTVNVLAYVAEVYCPVDPGVFALAGLVQLQEAIAGVVRYLDNPALKLAGLVVSRASRDNLTRDTERQLRETFGDLVCKATVPASIKVGEAHARFQSVLDYAPGSPGAKAFLALTREILSHGQQTDRVGRDLDGASPGDDSAGPRARRRRAG